MTVAKSNTRVMITIPKDLLKIAKEEANKQNRSLSNYIVNILEKNLKKDTENSLS